MDDAQRGERVADAGDLWRREGRVWHALEWRPDQRGRDGLSHGRRVSAAWAWSASDAASTDAEAIGRRWVRPQQVHLTIRPHGSEHEHLAGEAGDAPRREVDD